MHQFSERETERYYDEEDSTYRAFWDSEGSLHWGYFDTQTGGDFLAACRRLNQVMLERSGIGADSLVLDLGCGNGNTSIWLAQQRPCRVTGIDLSGVRIQNAIDDSAKLPQDLASKLRFQKESATDLPFADATFTHVWSQATIYHVPDKEAALREVYRTLQPGGVFIFDDLIKPNAQVSENARRYVYDRLLFDTPFNFQTYQDSLRDKGFDITQAEDLSLYLKTSYEKLRELARQATEAGKADLGNLVAAYGHMSQAVVDGDLGWAMYLCRK